MPSNWFTKHYLSLSSELSSWVKPEQTVKFVTILEKMTLCRFSSGLMDPG